MFGFALPPPAPSEINEDDIPALGRLKTTITLADGYTLIKTLLTDDGNLFILTRKPGSLDAIWWAKQEDSGNFTLHLDVPVVTGAEGYGAINDFDYIRELPGLSNNALLAVGYPYCPTLNLNNGGYTVRDTSKKPGCFAVYSIQDNYGPAVLMSAGHDTVYSSFPGGIDGWMNLRLTSTVDQMGYQVKFVYLNQTGFTPVLLLAVTAPNYQPQGIEVAGMLITFEVRDGVIQHYHDISKTTRVGVVDMLFGHPTYAAQRNLGKSLSTNCTSSGLATDNKWLVASIGNGGALIAKFSNNGGTGNITTQALLNATYDNFGYAVSVSNTWLAVSQLHYLDTVGLGAVYLYNYSSSAWTLLQTITAPYTSGFSSLSNFGSGIQLSTDAAVLAISEPNRHTYGVTGANTTRYLQAGGVHVYEQLSTYGSEGTPFLYRYTNTVYPASLVNGTKFGSNFSLAPDTTKLDANATKLPEVNLLAVVGSNPTAITVFTAGGFNGHVANDD